MAAEAAATALILMHRDSEEWIVASREWVVKKQDLSHKDQIRYCDPLPFIYYALFTIDYLNFGGELAIAKLGANLFARVEFDSLFDQAAMGIEDKGVSAGKNGLRLERLQAAAEPLPAGATTQ